MTVLLSAVWFTAAYRVAAALDNIVHIQINIEAGAGHTRSR